MAFKICQILEIRKQLFVENNVLHHLHKLYTNKTILGHEERKKRTSA
jgi:hypothetical protein